MKIDFVPKFIMLLAGAIVCVITIVNDMDTTYSLELLLGTLVIFYLIGLVAKKLIQKVIDGNMFVRRNAGGINMELPEEQEESQPVQPGQVQPAEEDVSGEES